MSAKVVASGLRWAVVAEDGTRTLWPTRAKARAYARLVRRGSTWQPPVLERVMPGLHQVRMGQGEASGWMVEHMPSPRPPGASLGLPWVTTDAQGRVVSEHYTLADARGSMPQVLR